MKRLLLGCLGLLWVQAADAAMLQDWSAVRSGENAGSFADSDGSKVGFSAAEGPTAGSHALRVDSTIVHWGGVWAAVEGGLTPGGALRFQAKADKTMQLRVALNDSQKLMVIHSVRVQAGSWQAFELPVASFRKPDWKVEGAPAGAEFDVHKLASLSFSALDPGASGVLVGAVEAVAEGGALKDGQIAADVAQDFAGLPAEAYGSFADPGSKLAVTLRQDAPNSSGTAAYIAYELKDQGWCGAWIRAGGTWNGQDWSKVKALEAEVYSETDLSLQAAFNDANQNAYQSAPLTVAAGAWRTVDIPLASFSLNQYYQPPKAKKGAPLDLSRVDTFNLSPLTTGKHAFWVRIVRLQR